MTGCREANSSANLLVWVSDTGMPLPIRPRPEVATTMKFVFTSWATS